MKIALGADGAGYDLKEFIKDKLIENKYEVQDLGTLHKDEEVKFMYAADNVAKAIQAKKADFGIVFCGSGAGVSICANKHKGIYCVPCESEWAARSARFINNANVLALGERIVAPVMAWDMVNTFLNTEFHQDADEKREAVLEGLMNAVREQEEKWF